MSFNIVFPVNKLVYILNNVSMYVCMYVCMCVCMCVCVCVCVCMYVCMFTWHTPCRELSLSRPPSYLSPRPPPTPETSSRLLSKNRWKVNPFRSFRVTRGAGGGGEGLSRVPETYKWGPILLLPRQAPRFTSCYANVTPPDALFSSQLPGRICYGVALAPRKPK